MKNLAVVAMILLLSSAIVRAQEERMLTSEQKKILLEIARKSIQEYLSTGRSYKPEVTDPELKRPSGAFVTLERNGEFHGCIGYIEPVMPLADAVAHMAVEAAVNDPRSPKPLRQKDLNEISVEISVLSPLERIKDISDIEVGKHGLLIKKGFYQGLLLPQVATEYGWNREEFLGHTCNKAGLPFNEWKKGVEIYIFSADVFNDAQK
ncbi:MAG: AmmeMemoRadiSam system protein A [Candidatus Omnitrophota bacterium]